MHNYLLELISTFCFPVLADICIVPWQDCHIVSNIAIRGRSRILVPIIAEIAGDGAGLTGCTRGDVMDWVAQI